MSTAGEVRAVLGIFYCQTCRVDTIPHEFTGRCFFCDRVIADAAAAAARDPSPLPGDRSRAG